MLIILGHYWKKKEDQLIRLDVGTLTERKEAVKVFVLRIYSNMKKLAKLFCVLKTYCQIQDIFTFSCFVILDYP